MDKLNKITMAETETETYSIGWLSTDWTETTGEPRGGLEADSPDRMLAEAEDCFDQRAGASGPIVRLTEEQMLARYIFVKKKRGSISKEEADEAMAFLDKHKELWEGSEENFGIEEMTPPVAWDLVKWQRRTYEVYLRGLKKVPIEMESLSRSAQCRAQKEHNLSDGEADLMRRYIRRYWALINGGAEEEPHWLVKRGYTETPAWLYETLPFKRTFTFRVAQNTAKVIERQGSRIPLFSIIKKWYVQFAEEGASVLEQKLLFKDARRLWELWKIARFRETHNISLNKTEEAAPLRLGGEVLPEG